MQDIYDQADSIDHDIASGQRLTAIARFAKRHGFRARIVGSAHVLVVSPCGEVLATRTATRLAQWLGY